MRFVLGGIGVAVLVVYIPARLLGLIPHPAVLYMDTIVGVIELFTLLEMTSYLDPRNIAGGLTLVFGGNLLFYAISKLMRRFYDVGSDIADFFDVLFSSNSSSESNTKGEKVNENK